MKTSIILPTILNNHPIRNTNITDCSFLNYLFSTPVEQPLPFHPWSKIRRLWGSLETEICLFVKGWLDEDFSDVRGLARI